MTGAEPEVVGPHLAGVLHDERWRSCQVALISGGKSNLTYRIESDAGEVVLRRPPLGHVLPTAHDMVREYRVQSALEPTAVPVPRMLYLGEPDGVLGASFYVMERVVGHICRNRLPAGYADTPAERGAIGQALIEALARLHAIGPADVGLEDFGRPAGFMERQLRRWSEQWQRSKVAELPALDALREDLARTLPPQRAQSDRARGLPARQHDPSPDQARANRRCARLGDEHARRSVSPTSARCSPTGASPATTKSSRRRGSCRR